MELTLAREEIEEKNIEVRRSQHILQIVVRLKSGRTNSMRTTISSAISRALWRKCSEAGRLNDQNLRCKSTGRYGQQHNPVDESVGPSVPFAQTFQGCGATAYLRNPVRLRCR